MQGALADMSLAELLERVAARTPTPGGGSSAALTCALGAALVEMAARFADPDSPAAAVARRAAELRDLVLSLAEEDLQAYGPVLAALRIPVSDPGRAQALDAARARATDPPLGVARAAVEVAELGVTAGRGGSAHLIGDAITGVLLAAAAGRSAAELVALNLAGQADDPRRAQAAELAKRAARASEQICAIRED